MSRFGHLELGDDAEERSRSDSPVKDSSLCLAQAQRAFEEGDFQEALKLFARALEYDPQDPKAWTGQVRMLIELEDFHEAKLWADKALEKFPHQPELLAAKAVTLGRQGELDAALAFSDASIEGQPPSPYPWLARADVLLANKDKHSEYCFEKALLIAPAEWLWHWLAARIRCYYGQFSLALKHVQDAVRLNGAQSVIWLQMGLCQQALGLFDPARMSFEQARQLNPRCAAATQGLNELRRTGGWSQLRSKFRRLFSS